VGYLLPQVWYYAWGVWIWSLNRQLVIPVSNNAAALEHVNPIKWKVPQYSTTSGISQTPLKGHTKNKGTLGNHNLLLK